MKARGLEEIACVEGDAFNPKLHEAAKTVPGAPEGKITEVIRKGYAFCGEIIRHPLVAVGKGEEGK